MSQQDKVKKDSTGMIKRLIRCIQQFTAKMDPNVFAIIYRDPVPTKKYQAKATFFIVFKQEIHCVSFYGFIDNYLICINYFPAFFF